MKYAWITAHRDSYDSAVMERFSSLKNEWTNHREFADDAAA